VLNKLEKKIYDVQLSTRTTFPEFSSVHNNLRLKFRWYYYWHTNRLSSLVHTILLILFTAGSFLSIYNIFVPNSKAIDSDSITLTSQEEWQDGTGNNIDYDTTPGDMTIDLEQKAYSLTDIPDESIIESGDPTTSGKNNITDGNTESYWQFSNATASTSANVVIDIGELIEINQLDVYSWCPAMEYECQILTSTDNVSYSFLGSAGGLLEGETVFTGSRITRYLKISASSVGYEGYEAQARINEIILSAKILGAQHITDDTQLDGGANLSSWTTLESSASVPANSSLNYRFRTSDNATEWDTWSTSTAHSAEINLATLLGETASAKRYLQIESTFSSTDGLAKPIISDYVVNYEYDDTPAVSCSDGIQNGDETGIDCGGSCIACPGSGTCQDGYSAENSNYVVTSQADWDEGEKSANISSAEGSLTLSTDIYDLCADTSKISIDGADAFFPKENGCDSDTDTKWSITAPETGEHYWMYDSHLSPLLIGSIRVLPTGGPGGEAGADAVRLEYSSDNSNWTIMTVLSGDNWSTPIEYDPPIYAPYFRYVGDIVQQGGDNPVEFGLAEIEVASPLFGVHTSSATQIDGGADFNAWTTFVPNATIPANTSVAFRFRTSPNGTNWSDWSASTLYASSIDISALSKYRYLQTETTLSNSDGVSTPILHEYTANYEYCIEDVAPPTCSDGIQNGDETGIDCGGSCPPCEVPALDPTCSDGIQNQGEEGVDCGGPCPPCETIESDSGESEEEIQDQEETVQPAITTTETSFCYDGIQDGDETGIDCGGSCLECAVNTQYLEVTITPLLPRIYAGNEVDYYAKSLLSDGTDVTKETVFDFNLVDGGIIKSISDNRITVKAGDKANKFENVLTVTGKYLDLSDSQQAGIEVIKYASSDRKTPICDSIWCKFADKIKEIVRGIISPYNKFFTGGLLFSALAALLGLVSNLISLIRSLRFYSAFVKGKNKRLDKSVVYDAQTGSPIHKAKIELIDKEHNVLEAVAVTDREGKFSINLTPGKKYLIKVEKDNYQQICNSNCQSSVGLIYQNNYFGEEFVAGDDETLFIKNIPLEIIYLSDKLFSIKHQASIIRVLVMLNFIIYFVGLFYSTIATIIDPSPYNYGVILLYIITALIFLTRYLFIDGRTFGNVINDLQPVELAVVRAVHKDSRILVKTVVSDIKGRYSMALPKGNYQIKANKSDLEQKDEIDVIVTNSFDPRKETIEMIPANDSSKNSTDFSSIADSTSYHQTPETLDNNQIISEDTSLPVEHQPEFNDNKLDDILSFDNNPPGNNTNSIPEVNSLADKKKYNDNSTPKSIDHGQATSADDIIDNYYHNKDS